MRSVIQRVLNCSVQVNGEIIASIEKGILALIGIHSNDSEEDANYIINKIIGLRIFNDENDLMNLSLADINGEILFVSQFTLYGDARKGRRPSYSEAMPPEKAKIFYDTFISTCKMKYPRVKSGIFGADMNISLINSGPVTILLDSNKSF